jgi:hypothetical protein
MNANELADELEKCIKDGSTDLVCVDKAATMLRQQQEKLTKYELRHVAQRDRIAILEAQHKQQQAEIEALKAKTLTDEVYFCSRCGKRLGDGIHTCTPPADILRKAQEK